MFELPFFVLLPKRSELTNLMAPNCPSTTHLAFAAIRVEPTLWQLGQAAGTAAALAKGALHDLPVSVVQARLLEQKVFIHWPPRPSCDAPPPPPPTPAPITCDVSSPAVTAIDVSGAAAGLNGRYSRTKRLSGGLPIFALDAHHQLYKGAHQDGGAWRFADFGHGIYYEAHGTNATGNGPPAAVSGVWEAEGEGVNPVPKEIACVRGSQAHQSDDSGSSTPSLSFVSSSPLNMELPSAKTSFEGGTVIRDAKGLHLFTTDTSRGIVNTSLVYYFSPASEGGNGTFRFVREVVCCSEGVLTGHRASLWAPMPVFDQADDLWRLFYVQYSSSLPASNASGWFFNFDGQIASAVSTVKGRDGIGGPYAAPVDGQPAVVLEPDAESQSWEGLQGTDSISPPFLLRDGKTWAAFYGSAQTEKIPRPHGIWWNGLVTTSKLGDRFVRRLPSAKVDLNGGGSENPVVTWLPQHRCYIALFDDLFAEARGFGLSSSADGLAWQTPAEVVAVPGGTRTPMASMLEDDGSLTVFYTDYGVGGGPERIFRAKFEISRPLKSDDPGAVASATRLSALLLSSLGRASSAYHQQQYVVSGCLDPPLDDSSYNSLKMLNFSGIFGERTATTPQGAAAQAKLCAKHGLEACFPGHAGADTVPLNGSVHGYYLKDEPYERTSCLR